MIPGELGKVTMGLYCKGQHNWRKGAKSFGVFQLWRSVANG